VKKEKRQNDKAIIRIKAKTTKRQNVKKKVRKNDKAIERENYRTTKRKNGKLQEREQEVTRERYSERKKKLQKDMRLYGVRVSVGMGCKVSKTRVFRIQPLPETAPQGIECP